MSFDYPAAIQQDIQQYAQTEHITADEAALKIVQLGLNAIRKRPGRAKAPSKPKAPAHEITEAALETLRQSVPIFAFLEKLPDSVIDGMEAASKQIRAERFTPRG